VTGLPGWAVCPIHAEPIHKKAGVEANLVIKKGAGHGWLGLKKDEAQIVDWFDKHLKKAS
jgi:hypothetical protein